VRGNEGFAAAYATKEAGYSIQECFSVSRSSFDKGNRGLPTGAAWALGIGNAEFPNAADHKNRRASLHDLKALASSVR